MVLKGNTTGVNNVQSIMEIMQRTTLPPMPPVKPPKKNKIERIYEDDDFVIDLFTEEKMVRVSMFDGGHFKDEIFVRKDDYI